MALAYFATVTTAVVDMIMSLVTFTNKKLILRPLNIVHEVEFNEKESACLEYMQDYTKLNMTIFD